MRNQNTPIAAEGFPFIAGAVFVTIVCAILSLKVLFVIGLCTTLFIAFFFRNPQRTTPGNEQSIVAPADGVVIFIGKANETHLKTEMLKISIFMSVFNVHVNRVPVTGRVVDSFYRKGKFLDVRDARATFENEQSGLVIQTERGEKIVVVQVAGLVARRIVCYAMTGDRLTRGERYGLIRFGSRLDVYLPIETNLGVKLGDITVAGETVLGYMP